eukprot:TRINITY_DN16039_c0_g1_i1.p1 TRINITY_DN16039_c0_g1~~TRINITY_DN16039_c0_g1_i1.p1  ORF type:complete len:306 (-),score=34.41 TRINITY_DN16039_c0_g1_i1:16-840(-)
MGISHIKNWFLNKRKRQKRLFEQKIQSISKQSERVSELIEKINDHKDQEPNEKSTNEELQQLIESKASMTVIKNESSSLNMTTCIGPHVVSKNNSDNSRYSSRPGICGEQSATIEAKIEFDQFNQQQLTFVQETQRNHFVPNVKISEESDVFAMVPRAPANQLVPISTLYCQWAPITQFGGCISEISQIPVLAVPMIQYHNIVPIGLGLPLGHISIRQAPFNSQPLHSQTGNDPLVKDIRLPGQNLGMSHTPLLGKVEEFESFVFQVKNEENRF